MKKYLPSKKFMYLLGSFAVIGIVFVLIFLFFSGKISFSNKKESGKLSVDRLSMAGLTVNDLIKKDSDNDGVSDWEESLWGTDKNNPISFNGTSDKTYISNKKKELNVDQSKDENGITETEKFAREFFTTYIAMKASGEVDATTINNFSSALGQKIVTPNLVDKYFIKDIKTIENNELKDKITYYTSIKKLFDSGKKMGIGDELGIVEKIASGDTTTDEENLTRISNAYQDFAKNAINVNVPSVLKDEHLKIVNNAHNTGISVFNMTKTVGDPIVGLSGLSQYKKYSNDLIVAVNELEEKIKQ